MSKIRISGIIRESYVDGEGIRYVIFTQGCNHKCKGCQNIETWDFNGGEYKNSDDIINEIKSNLLLDGITLSGGDPFYQAKQLIDIAKWCKENNLTVWAYTGFIFEQFIEFINNDKNLDIINDDMINLLQYIDVLVDGPFVEGKKSLNIRFRGSTNQRLIDVKASFDTMHTVEYTPED